MNKRKERNFHHVPTASVTNLDVGNIGLELLQALLYLGVLLGHLLVLGLPLVALLLESLNLALEVAGLDVGLAKPVKRRKAAC